MASEKKTRNDENIAQVKKALFAAGYECGHNMRGAGGDMEFFVGPGAIFPRACAVNHASIMRITLASRWIVDSAFAIAAASARNTRP